MKKIRLFLIALLALVFLLTSVPFKPVYADELLNYSGNIANEGDTYITEIALPAGEKTISITLSSSDGSNDFDLFANPTPNSYIPADVHDWVYASETEGSDEHIDIHRDSDTDTFGDVGGNEHYSIGVYSYTGTGDFTLVATSSEGLYNQTFHLNDTYSAAATNTDTLSITPITTPEDANAAVVVVSYVAVDNATTHVEDVTDTDSYNFQCSAETTAGSVDGTNAKFIELWTKVTPDTSADTLTITMTSSAVEVAATMTTFSGADGTSPFLQSICEAGDPVSETGYNMGNIVGNALDSYTDIAIAGATQAKPGSTASTAVYSGTGGTASTTAAELKNQAMDNGDLNTTANWAGEAPSYQFSDSTAETLIAGIIVTPSTVPAGDTTAPVFGTFDNVPSNPSGADTSISGEVTDDVQMSTVTYNVDGGEETPANIYNDTQTYRFFSFDVQGMSSGDHSITVTAKDLAGNTATHTFNFAVSLTPPVLDFTASPDDVGGTTYKPGYIDIEGHLNDDVGIGYTQLRIDGGDYHDTWMVDQTATYLRFFTSVQLPSGHHTMDVRGVDTNNNETIQTFSFDVDADSPVCTGMPHLGKYIHTTQLTYTGIQCTDNTGVVQGHFFAYHGGFGTLSEGDVNPVVGSLGDTEVTFDFTTADGLLDGGYYIGFRAYDDAGNYTEPHDGVIIETVDDSIPTLFLDPILPATTRNDQPYISGSCGDTQEFDTNSFISSLQFQLDGQDEFSWTDVPPVSGVLGDAYSESFNYQVPTPVSLGDHTMYVVCRDATDHGVVSFTNFTVIAQDDNIPPVVVSVNESFDSANTYDDGRSSGVVWGNGKLRLKESISLTEDTLDTTDPITSAGAVAMDPDGITVWYSTGNSLVHYNPNTNIALRTYTTSDLSTSFIGRSVPVSNSGTTYVWVNGNQGIRLLNATTDQVAEIALGEAAAIEPDARYGNLNIWMVPGGGGEARYLDTNGTPFDTDDDIITQYTAAEGYDGFFNVHHMTGGGVYTNLVFGSTYLTGLFKWDDKGTPNNKADDTIIHYDGLNAIFWMTDDAHGNMYYAINFGTVGKVGVVTDGGTPMNISDDLDTLLADAGGKLRQETPGYITYLVGQNGIGDQLFVQGGSGTVIYININNTPTNLQDDTFIFWDLSESITQSVSFVAVGSYNTLYVSKTNASLVKETLHRGFVTSGEAFATGTPPIDQLLTNNIMISDISELTPIDMGGGTSSLAYYVSVDGGLTWTQINPNQITQLDNHDYRVKVKILFTSNGARTNVLGAYKLTFGGYTTPEQLNSQNLIIVPDSTTITVSTGFGLTAQVIDDLQYRVPDYTGTVELSLVDFNTSQPVNGALSVTSIPIEDGIGQVLGAQITQPGEYRLLATTDGLTAQSPKIVVANAPISSSSSNSTVSQYIASSSSSSSSTTSSAGTDTDGDGLTDVFENQYGNSDHPLDPTKQDSDGDGVSDADEDFDNDGLTNLEEQTAGTNPTNPDTDFDGIPDGVDSNPLVPATSSSSSSSAAAVNVGLIESLFGSGEIAQTVSTAINNVVDTLRTSSVETTPRILAISTVGVAAAGALAYPEAIAYPRIILGFLWFRRKKRTPWGVVYENNNRKPIPFATIRVYAELNGGVQTLIKQTVSDLNGKYDMEVDPGKYILKATVGGFQDFAQTVSVDNSQYVNQDIPMVRTGSAGLLHSLRVNFHALSGMIFYVGLVFAVISVLLSPILVNFIILTLFLIQVLAYRLVSTRKGGQIYDYVTQIGVSGAFVRVYNRDQQQQVDVSITDDKGRYSIRLPAGDYLLRVEAPGFVFPSHRLGQKVETLASGLEFMPIRIYEEQKIDIQVGLDKIEGAAQTTEKTNPFA